MDEFIDGIGSISEHDSFELAAMQYFEELDRKAGKDPLPAPPLPSAEAEPDPEALPVDLGDDLDSLTFHLMSDTERPAPQTAPAPARKPPKKPPFMRKDRNSAAAPVQAEPDPAAASLSELAMQAARLFEALPTEDQLLAYTLLQKLAKAADKD